MTTSESSPSPEARTVSSRHIVLPIDSGAYRRITLSRAVAVSASGSIVLHKYRRWDSGVSGEIGVLVSKDMSRLEPDSSGRARYFYFGHVLVTREENVPESLRRLVADTREQAAALGLPAPRAATGRPGETP